MSGLPARAGGGVTGEIRVLLVDDDALVRAGLSMMLDGADGLVIVGEAGDGDQVPGAVARHRPDVVLMDLRMPRVDGITATRRLRAGSRPPEIIVLTTFDADENVLGALRAGASGFLLKDAPPAEIAEAIRRVAAGDPMLSPAVTRRLMHRAAAHEDAKQQALRQLETLSPREREVVRAIAEGQTNAEIAASLLMSVPTVKAHVTHVLTKAGLTNRTQIALLAHDAGLALASSPPPRVSAGPRGRSAARRRTEPQHTAVAGGGMARGCRLQPVGLVAVGLDRWPLHRPPARSSAGSSAEQFLLPFPAGLRLRGLSADLLEEGIHFLW
jgi:DNA-binding NarL/FixJ family response regulator